jgi:small subunit ribosomal protein S17
VSETENETTETPETPETPQIPKPETVEAPVAEEQVAEAPEPATDEPAETEAESTESPEEPEPAAAEAEAPAAPVKKQRPRKHVPRTLRRQRPKTQRERPAQRRPIVRLPKPDGERGRRQERRGIVVSNAMDKTIVVKVDMIKIHPRYKKVIRRSKKFHAHDEQNKANVGDVVRIVETRPLSKTKNWRLAEVVEVAK